jgi:hypothetical protein
MHTWEWEELTPGRRISKCKDHDAGMCVQVHSLTARQNEQQRGKVAGNKAREVAKGYIS